MDVGGLPFDPAGLAELCRRHRIRRLALFGSRLHGDPRPDSDIDLVVEFEPGTAVGLRFFRIQEELSAFFGLPVDLSTARSLSPRFREQVLQEAVGLYDAA